jgi:hypothetical protein
VALLSNRRADLRDGIARKLGKWLTVEAANLAARLLVITMQGLALQASDEAGTEEVARSASVMAEALHRQLDIGLARAGSGRSFAP